MPIIKGFFPTLSTLGFHHADQRWFEKCESEDGAEDFGTRAAPLQDELVEVQRKKGVKSKLTCACIADSHLI